MDLSSDDPARRTHRRTWLAVAILLGWAFSSNLALAEQSPISTFQVDMGAPPDSVAAAATTRAAREAAALQATACGQETSFLDDANKHSSGEDIANKLVAKAAWLARGAQNCTVVVNMPIDFNAGLFNTNYAATFGTDCAQPVTFSAREEPSQLEKNEKIVAGHIRTTFRVSNTCLRHQVNLVIMGMQVSGQPGTDKLPCHPGADFTVSEETAGDWDVTVRDLVRIYYMSKMVSAAPGGTMLDPDTKAHLFNDLLTIDGAPLPDDYPLAGCGDTERSTGTPADRADERSWAEENFSWLSDVWDALKWIGLILLLIIIVILLVLLTIFTAGAGLPLWAALPIVAVEVAVALGVAVLAVAAVVASLARVPETENHLLMINTSRYLTNQLIIQANPTDVDFFVEDQKKVKAWLLARLQRITARDFDEFNARPYQRYSIIALLNLHDFGPCNPALRDANIDCDLRTATEIVLDLATAKFEAGSNEGRRSAPFRRLMEAVGDDVADSRRLTQGDSDSDYMFGFMLDYAGHTQHLPDHKAQFGTAAEMIYPATSNYQPAPAVMSLALGPKNFEQRIHHAGVEIYSSTPSFLISAGGIRTVAATAFSVGPIKNLGERCVDRGAALPTVLIPGGGQYQAAPPWSDAVQRNDFLRIEGFYYHYGRTALCLAPNDDAQTAPPPLQADKAKADRTNDMWSNDDNICVHKGFACGTNIIVPPALAPCFTPQPGTPWSFLNSATCAGLPASAPFHVALYVKPCPAGAKDCLNNWGFFEAVEGLPGAAGAAGFVVFKLRTLSNNPASLIPDPSGGDNPALGGTYVSARGERIEFDAAATFNDKARPGVGKVNGTAVADINKWPRAEGDVIASKTCPGAVFPFVIEGQYEITGHQNGVTIDFCDVANPKRVLH